MSRPFLPRNVRRNHSITARFTDGEAAMLRSVSRCDHTTVSNIVRQLCIIGLKIQSLVDSNCDVCSLLADEDGTYEFNPDTIDKKCFECLLERMIEASGIEAGGYDGC